MDMDKIANTLGATRLIQEPDGNIHVFGPGRDRKIELLTEEEAVARTDLERMGWGEGQDFFHCLYLAGRGSNHKVWDEATVYTSSTGETYPLRLSFYKPRT